MSDLIGFLPHGPSKLYLDKIIDISDANIIASYKVKEKDTLDHFDYFRGVDQIEAAGQAAIVWAISRINLEAKKKGKKIVSYTTLLSQCGKVSFNSAVNTGDEIIILCENKMMRNFCLSNCYVYKLTSDYDLAELKKSGAGYLKKFSPSASAEELVCFVKGKKN